MKTCLSLLLLFFLMIFTSCKKKDPEPDPKPKHIPSNYMVAKVDGADWKACRPLPFSPTSGQYYLGGVLKLSGNKFCGENNSYIYIELRDVKDTGTFILNTYHWAAFSGPERDSTGSLSPFVTTDAYTGKFVLTQLDTQRLEISGRFEFEAYNKEINKVRKVSEGFFNKVKISIY